MDKFKHIYNKINIKTYFVFIVGINLCLFLLTNHTIQLCFLKLFELIFQKAVNRDQYYEFLNNIIPYLFFVVNIFCVIYPFFKNGYKYQSFSFIIFLFFILSNIGIQNDKNFEGYKNVWNNSDFTICIRNGYGKGSLYTTNYPPLAVLLFRYLHTYVLFDDVSVSENAVTYITNLFFIFITIAIYIVIYKYMKNVKYKEIYTTCLFLTNIMLFAYQRFNIALIALIFVMIFLLYYESNNKVHHNISLFSLAIAANLKYYPAIYGMLLLKNKKIKSAIICAIIAIALFVLPSFIPKNHPLVTNSYEKIESETISSDVELENNEDGINSADKQNSIIDDIKNLFQSTGNFVDKHSYLESSVFYRSLKDAGISSTAARTIRKIVIYINVLAMFVFFFITRKREYELTLLALISFYLIPTSNLYFLIFILPAIISFLEKKENGLNEYIGFIIWTMLLTFQWGFLGYYIFQDNIDHTWYIVLWIYTLFNCIRELILRKKDKSYEK